MAKVQEIGPYSAYAIAVKYGYKGTEEEWVKEQEANRKAAEAAAAAAAQSAEDAAASASGVAQSGQQAVQGIKDAQTAAEQAIDTAKQQAVQAAQAEAEKAATSAGQAASSAAEAAQSATNAAAEVGKVQSAGTSAVQAVQAAQNTATEAVSDAQQSATQAVSQAQTAAVSAVQEAGTTQTSAVASAASSALTNISGAKDAALSDVAEAGAAQVSAIGTTGADAVEDVNDAKTAALETIDAANAALPSPTQSDAWKVPTVKADGSAYELAGPYAPLSAAIRPTASGNPVSITDSVEWSLLGLKVYGKSTQVTTTGAQLFDTKSFTEKKAEFYKLSEDGGIIQIKEDYQGASTVPISQELAAGTYTASISTTNFTFQVIQPGGESGAATLSKPFTFTLEAPAQMRFKVWSSQAADYSRTTAYPMLVSGSTAKPWEPYTGGKPSPSPEYPRPIVSAGDGGSIVLTVSDGADRSQSLTISTPNGLPGIPVDSDGNYTDAEGQQRVCNYKDYARGVYVQRCALEKIAGTPNFRETPDRPGRYLWANVLTNTYDNGGIKALSTFGKWESWGIGVEIGFAVADRSIYFNYLKSGAADEVNALFSNLIETNQCYVLGQLAAPIETPLPEEELTAYRALHTYDGTTVVSTAEDVAGLEVRYIADAQKYIDDRLTAAESHIQEIAAAQLNAQTGG